MELSNIFSDMKFYKNDELVHSFTSIPKHKASVIISAWDSEIKSGRVNRVDVIDGDTVRSTSLSSSKP